MAIFKKDEVEVAAPQPAGLSVDQLRELITEVIAAAKKPNEYEQRKIDQEIALEKRRALDAVALGKAEEESRINRKRNCPHHNGQRHTWVAQVHTPANSDPYFIPTCQRCFTQLKPIKASADQVTQGVNLHVYKTLDMAALERMGESQVPVHG